MSPNHPSPLLNATVIALAIAGLFGEPAMSQIAVNGIEELPAGITSTEAKLVGTGSCTASGCHGGAHAEQITGSEYNVWMSKDPHARAFSDLFNERSQEISRQLNKDLPAGKPIPAYADDRCLACHSTIEAAPLDINRDVLLSDGVSCEACHGPASKWLSVHYEHRLTSVERRELGMRETKNLWARAQICARCHIGDSGRESGTRRDVDHDLIAAGHPRLQFDLSAYHESMPKHWAVGDGRSGRNAPVELRADFDALVWVEGQISASKAALEQLKARAEEKERARPVAARAADKKRDWPDFSEWNCSACHHQLRNEADRQERLAAPNQLMEWDTWNHFATRWHAVDLCQAFGLDVSLGQRAETTIKQLADEMRKLNPDRVRVAGLAEDALRDVESLAMAIERSGASPRVEILTQALLQNSNTPGLVDWSSAAQIYDALASLHDTRLRQSFGIARQPANDPVTNAMRRMYADLAAPPRLSRNKEFRREAFKGQMDELGKLVPKENSR